MQLAMTQTVIIPYTPRRITSQDITRLKTSLTNLRPGLRVKAFDLNYIPLWLAKKFTADTVTVTLNNDLRPDIFDFIPGPQFFAPERSKTQLLKALIQAGLPVPHSQPFNSNATPGQEQFGPYIAIKTTAPGTTRAYGITVCKTADFAALKPEIENLYQSDIAKGYMPVLQQYVPTGPNPCHTRITTFLGSPIVCFTTTAILPFDPAKMSGIAQGEATSNFKEERARQLVEDEGFVALARKVAAIFPETSVLSIDMVRCADTRKIYCLEANQGNLSVLSAPICESLRRDLGASEVLAQFSAYDTMASRIVEILDAGGSHSEMPPIAQSRNVTKGAEGSKA